MNWRFMVKIFIWRAWKITLYQALKHLNTKQKKEIRNKDIVPSATLELEVMEARNKLKMGVRELLKEVERFESKTICQYNLSREI